MPYQEAEKTFVCARCGKRRREGYVNGNTGVWSKVCADCHRATHAAKRQRAAEKRLPKTTAKKATAKRLRAGKGRTPSAAA